MADVFLSYSTQDVERVRLVVATLEQAGWSVWWDRSTPPGKSWHRMIEKELDDAKCVVVVWSENSVNSEWVRIEAEEGKSRDVLIPVMIDNVRPPLSFRLIQAARLIGWQGESSHPEFRSLLESIGKIIGPAISDPPMSAKQVIDDSLRQAVPLAPKGDLKTEVKKNPVVPVSQGLIEDLGNGVKLEMVAIPGGEFMMGSKTFDSSQPIHKVSLKPFCMGKYPITQAQWKAVMGENPSRFKGDDLPVESVSWEDARAFCQELSKRTGKEYRLPTEAEWEYAARAGSTGDFCFGDDVKLLDDYGWYGGNSGGSTHPVGKKKPNNWGLHDVHGNVWEWCEDVWHDNYKGAPDDGSAWVHGGNQDRRLLRGGSWGYFRDSARAVYRDLNFPLYRSDGFGFRVVVLCGPPSQIP